MLDERRIRKMTELARIEKKDKGESFRIGSYFISDYIGTRLMKGFVSSTIIYCLLLVILAFCHLEWLLGSFASINFVLLGACLVIGYLLFLGVMLALTYIQAMLRYQKARKSMERYELILEQLQEDYRELEKREMRRRERR